jgi:hypothetical protein
MPDFIPVLIAAILGLIVLLLIFGGGFGFFPYGGEELDSSRTITLGEDFTVSYLLGEETVATFGGEVNNGLFSNLEQRNDFDIEKIGDVSEGIIKLKIWNSNYYGNFMIFINGKEIYIGAPSIGEKSISFNSTVLETNNVIEVKAESSGWKIWAPAVYIFDIDVSVSYKGKQTQSFDFDLTNTEVTNVNRGRLLVFGTREGNGNLEARLNGIEIYAGRTPIYIDFAVDTLRRETNTIDLSTEPNTRYNISSAQIVLFFG